MKSARMWTCFTQCIMTIELQNILKIKSELMSAADNLPRLLSSSDCPGEKPVVLQPGLNCGKIYASDMHRGCLATRALAGREAAFATAVSDGRERAKFWLSLDGYPEYFVHFSVGSPETHRQAASAQ